MRQQIRLKITNSSYWCWHGRVLWTMSKFGIRCLQNLLQNWRRSQWNVSRHSKATFQYKQVKILLLLHIYEGSFTNHVDSNGLSQFAQRLKSTFLKKIKMKLATCNWVMDSPYLPRLLYGLGENCPLSGLTQLHMYAWRGLQSLE